MKNHGAQRNKRPVTPKHTILIFTNDLKQTKFPAILVHNWDSDGNAKKTHHFQTKKNPKKFPTKYKSALPGCNWVHQKCFCILCNRQETKWPTDNLNKWLINILTWPIPKTILPDAVTALRVADTDRPCSLRVLAHQRVIVCRSPCAAAAGCTRHGSGETGRSSNKQVTYSETTCRWMGHVPVKRDDLLTDSGGIFSDDTAFGMCKLWTLCKLWSSETDLDCKPDAAFGLWSRFRLGLGVF